MSPIGVTAVMLTTCCPNIPYCPEPILTLVLAMHPPSVAE